VLEFIQKLNQKSGLKFRLPTEGEWIYAAVGGKKSRGYKYSGSDTIGDVGWYDGNSGNKTHPVGSKSSNEMGIYDMSGNVWELCRDDTFSIQWGPRLKGPDSSRCTIRGGSWNHDARHCLVTFASFNRPDDRSIRMGFRLSQDK